MELLVLELLQSIIKIQEILTENMDYFEYSVVFQPNWVPHRVWSIQIYTWLWIDTHDTSEWPPHSLDLTPLDFSHWGNVKSKMYFVQYVRL